VDQLATPAEDATGLAENLSKATISEKKGEESEETTPPAYARCCGVNHTQPRLLELHRRASYDFRICSPAGIISPPRRSSPADIPPSRRILPRGSFITLPR
jgi:hypothetical protein